MIPDDIPGPDLTREELALLGQWQKDQDARNRAAYTRVEHLLAAGYPRWGVFKQYGDEWAELHRWLGNDLLVITDEESALKRAADVTSRVPETVIKPRQTRTPLPGPWNEEFAYLLPPEMRNANE